MKKRGIVALIFIFAFVVSVLAQEKVIVPVRTIDVKQAPISKKVFAIGAIKPKDEILFSTKLMGKIISLPYDEGDYCEKGSIVVKIDNSDLLAKKDFLKAQLDELKANDKALQAQLKEINVKLYNAKKDYDRLKDLLKRGSATQKSFDDAKTNYESILANRDMIKAKRESLNAKRIQIDASIREIDSNLKYAVLKAPFSGYITQKFANEGEISKPGAPIEKLLSLSDLKAEFIVNEVDIKDVKEGKKMIIHCDALPNRVFITKVSKIIPEGNDMNRSFRVQGVLENKDYNLKPGMFIRGEIVVDTHEKALIIPKDALMQNGDKYYVFVADGDKAKRRDIQKGYEDDYFVEIKSGLKLGDKVIIEGKENVVNDSTIRVINNK